MEILQNRMPYIDISSFNKEWTFHLSGDLAEGKLGV